MTTIVAAEAAQVLPSSVSDKLRRTLEDIAEARRVSVQTIRTQLKQVFSKTGTSRQSALTALVNRTVSPVSEPLP